MRSADLKLSFIVALPGPPRELQAMVHEELLAYLKKRFGTRLPGRSLMLRFVGLGQSQIDQTLEDHIALDEDISLSSQFQGGRVDFTFSLPHDTKEKTRNIASSGATTDRRRSTSAGSSIPTATAVSTTACGMKRQAL